MPHVPWKEPQSASAVLFDNHPKFSMGSDGEGWETTVVWWYSVSFAMIVAILVFEPETGIDAWAYKEATARLALSEQGFTDFVFGKHYQSMSAEDMRLEWDKHSNKAVRMTEDDDDDDDEEEEEDDDDDDDDDDEE